MRTFLLFFAALLPFSSFAYTPDLDTLSSVPRLQLDAAQVNAAIAAGSQAPHRYAVAQDLARELSAGTWSLNSDGLWHWRLRIASSGAVSLAALIDSLSLPDGGAELWLYTASGDDLQGPFTSVDNGRLWTPVVRGEEVVLDARMPDAARSAFQLKLTQAFHGFRSFSEAYPAKSSFGNSGACTIDTACSDGDAWRNEIRSVVLLTINGTTLCTGNLVTNTAQDDRALVLTAHHCGVTPLSIAGTRAYFNVQKPSCGADGEGPVDQNIAGKKVLASTSGTTVSDYTLFELRNPPPADYQAYYAGWDVGGAAPKSGVGISHPAGDDKKIATYSSPAMPVSDQCVGTLAANAACTGFTIDAWAVNWARGDTEGGSSGSGLWSQNHRIVGTLTSGTSACSGTGNNGGTDYYARLDRAWAAPSSTGTTLQEALDSTRSGCTSLGGRNPGSPAISCSSTNSSSSGGSGGSSGSSGSSGSVNSGGGSLDARLLCLLALALGRRRITARRASSA